MIKIGCHSFSPLTREFALIMAFPCNKMIFSVVDANIWFSTDDERRSVYRPYHSMPIDIKGGNFRGRDEEHKQYHQHNAVIRLISALEGQTATCRVSPVSRQQG